VIMGLSRSSEMLGRIPAGLPHQASRRPMTTFVNPI
jgi:hypothetical protein